VLPTTGWTPGFSACSGQHAWHSCRAGCIVISENPQGLATHMVQLSLPFFSDRSLQVKKKGREIEKGRAISEICKRKPPVGFVPVLPV